MTRLLNMSEALKNLCKAKGVSGLDTGGGFDYMGRQMPSLDAIGYFDLLLVKGEDEIPTDLGEESTVVMLSYNECGEYMASYHLYKGTASSCVEYISEFGSEHGEDHLKSCMDYVKKAFNPTEKYHMVKLQVRDGNHEYTKSAVYEGAESPKSNLTEYMTKVWGLEPLEGSDTLFEDTSERQWRFFSSVEVSKREYDILRKYGQAG